LASNASLSSELSQGHYSALLTWLNQNVHSHGYRYLPNAPMEKATGATTDLKAYLEHLRARYL